MKSNIHDEALRRASEKRAKRTAEGQKLTRHNDPLDSPRTGKPKPQPDQNIDAALAQQGQE